MVSQQLLEQHQLLRSNMDQQHELMVTLMKDCQLVQVKELEARHDRYDPFYLYVYVILRRQKWCDIVFVKGSSRRSLDLMHLK